MNGKTVLILEHLLDGRPHKLRDLAQRLEISVRLVRYEMQEVDAFLQREGFPALQYERPAGLRLMLTQAQHKALSKKLASLDTYDYAMTSAERRCVMTLMLIASGSEALTAGAPARHQHQNLFHAASSFPAHGPRAACGYHTARAAPRLYHAIHKAPRARRKNAFI